MERVGALQAPAVDHVTSRLRAMSRDGGSIEAAQIKVIGLDEIREAAGPRWPAMRQRVQTGSLNILQDQCGPDDVIIPAGDGFLVMFAHGKPGDSHRRCRQMRESLLRFYLGEDALSTLQPEVKRHALSREGLTQLVATSMQSSPDQAASGTPNEIGVAPLLVAGENPLAHLIGPLTRSGDRNSRRLCYNPDFMLDGHNHEREKYAELDIAVLDAAMRQLARTNGEGAAKVVGACVHSSTLQSRRSREAYLSWLADIDVAQRRRLFICIAEIERGAPLISISEWCYSLRSLVGRVCLEFHPSDHAIGSIGASGAWAAGFALPPFEHAQRGARAEKLGDRIRFWSKTLHGQGMRLLVQNFQDALFLERAASFGVDLLTSDAHWPYSSLSDDAEH